MLVSRDAAPPPRCETLTKSRVNAVETQMSLQRTAHRLLSTLTTYSPDRDQATALTGELRGEGNGES